MFGIFLSIADRSDLVNIIHIEQGEQVCSTNGGLRYIRGQSNSYHYLICANGAQFKYNPKKTSDE